MPHTIGEIPDDEWNAAKQAARERGETVTQAIRRFLKGYVNRHRREHPPGTDTKE